MWFSKAKLKRLQKAKIEGHITPDQEAVLNKILNKYETRSIDFQRLMEIEKHLEMTKPEDKPIDISSNVMQRITTDKRVTKPILSNAIFSGNIFNPVPVRFAVILLIGIFIGSAFTWIFTAEKNTTNNHALVGSLSATSDQAITYSNQNNLIKLIPYQIGNLHYLNFIVDARNEINFEVTFNESDFLLTKADYVVTQGNKSSSFNIGSIVFVASGMTSFQIILEKANETKASITITAMQNQSILISKRLFLE